MSVDSFLLSVESDRSGRSLTAWVRQGSRTTRHVIPYQASFLVSAQDLSLEEARRYLVQDKRVAFLRTREAALWLKSPPQPVLEVTAHRYRDLAAIATDLRKAAGWSAFEYHDVDLSIPARWMQERGLFPFAKVRITPSGIECIDDRWAIPYATPALRCIRLAAEPAVQGLAPAYSDPLARIRVGGRAIEAAGREKDALLELQNLIETEDPDVYFTDGGDAWDIPYLLARIDAHGLRGRVNLGRLPDPRRPAQEERSFHTYGRIVHRTEGWFLRGRFHVDLSKKFLPDSENRVNLHGLVYLARTSNMDLQRLARNSPGACIQQAQIDRALEEGVRIPWKRNLVEEWKPLSVLCEVDRGGQVHVPDPGVYEDVWSCDFSGYYPGLIVANNLSSETINCNCCPDSTRFVPGTTWHICIRREGHQVRTLRPYVEHRRYVKAVLRRKDLDLEVRAWASAIKDELKAIGVVCFGYARYKHARFGCAEVHQAIQAFGRQGMTRCKVIFEEAGFDRLHTLTDGIMLQKPGATEDEVKALCRRIGSEIGVPMEIDGAFDWVVLLPSKTMPGIGVPNRYFGRRRDGTVKIRGIELRRHSTPPWLNQVQQQILDRLAAGRTAAHVHRSTRRIIELGRDALRAFDQVPVEDLAVTATATREVEDYRQDTHVKIALAKLRQAGIAVHPGQTVSYIVLRGDAGVPAEQRAVPVQLVNARGRIGDAPLRADVQHYGRLLARSMETLLAPLGWTEEGLLAAMTGRQAGTQATLTVGVRKT